VWLATCIGVLATITARADGPATTQHTSTWRPEKYPISFWCGPPPKFVNDQQYQRIADANFTLIMPSCSGGGTPADNRKVLDTAQAFGLKAFLSDGRMPLSTSGSADAKQKLDAIVADYAAHPALAGYFITDEPGIAAFGGLGEVAAYLREKDPRHPAYINLLPNFALGAGYEQYLESFVAAVHPFALSYDHYHFLRNTDRPGFFENLDSVGRVARKHGLPFWNIVLAIRHLDYRELTEAEKRYEAMQTLAYGGKGLMWFTYWQPAADGAWGDAIIDFDGTPTRQYDEIMRINHDVQAIGQHLLNADMLAILPHDAKQPNLPARLDDGKVNVGLFRSGENLYAMLSSLDYQGSVTAKLLISSPAGVIEKLDKRTAQWQSAGADPAGAVTITLDAGDGELLRWKPAK
jgi:hypothetical protein